MRMLTADIWKGGGAKPWSVLILDADRTAVAYNRLRTHEEARLYAIDMVYGAIEEEA